MVHITEELGVAIMIPGTHPGDMEAMEVIMEATIPIMEVTIPIMAAHTGAGTALDITTDIGAAVTMVPIITIDMGGWITGTITDTPELQTLTTVVQKVPPMLIPNTGVVPGLNRLQAEERVQPLQETRRVRYLHVLIVKGAIRLERNRVPGRMLLEQMLQEQTAKGPTRSGP